ncbi:hypothetical protein BD626DRAFT_498475 [Schizophyllum amplum]|uniref:Secreted protein n=1 Tax=Schizophyllum amplum TaxID=97359 RepID=A0A550CBP4_9AGAR|nr:hypothetical protein BD626DRAFT_498475 [Auriculariopsis ampla]
MVERWCAVSLALLMPSWPCCTFSWALRSAPLSNACARCTASAGPMSPATHASMRWSAMRSVVERLMVLMTRMKASYRTRRMSLYIGGGST